MVTIICELAIGMLFSEYYTTHRHKVVIPRKEIREIKAGAAYTVVMKDGRRIRLPLQRCILMESR